MSVVGLIYPVNSFDVDGVGLTLVLCNGRVDAVDDMRGLEDGRNGRMVREALSCWGLGRCRAAVKTRQQRSTHPKNSSSSGARERGGGLEGGKGEAWVPFVLVRQEYGFVGRWHTDWFCD